MLTVGMPNYLPLGVAVIVPWNAINDTIVWSVFDADGTGATVSGNTLTNITAAGTIELLATIYDGVYGGDYDQLFEIIITPTP